MTGGNGMDKGQLGVVGGAAAPQPLGVPGPGWIVQWALLTTAAFPAALITMAPIAAASLWFVDLGVTAGFWSGADPSNLVFFGFVIAFALFLGVFQWFMLRRLLPRAELWFAATGAGILLTGLAAGIGLQFIRLRELEPLPHAGHLAGRAEPGPRPGAVALSAPSRPECLLDHPDQYPRGRFAPAERPLLYQPDRAGRGAGPTGRHLRDRAVAFTAPDPSRIDAPGEPATFTCRTTAFPRPHPGGALPRSYGPPLLPLHLGLRGFPAGSGERRGGLQHPRGSRDRAQQPGLGRCAEVVRIDGVRGSPNSHDGDQPHVWFGGATVHLDRVPEGWDRKVFSSGSYFIHVREGWVHISEGALPEFIGWVMELYGMEGVGR